MAGSGEIYLRTLRSGPVLLDRRVARRPAPKKQGRQSDRDYTLKEARSGRALSAGAPWPPIPAWVSGPNFEADV